MRTLGLLLLLGILTSLTAQTASPVDSVRRAILALPRYSVFDYLDCHMEDSRVVLTGQVVNAVLKTDAGQAAGKVPGAENLVNQIEVLPASTEDQMMRRTAYQYLFNDPALSLYGLMFVPPVHIIVKNKTITLEGTVNSATEKSAALEEAMRVPGVVSVIDHLRLP